MKAEINKEGMLILIAEYKEENFILLNWAEENKGEIFIPKNREELAYAKFDTIKIAITRITL